MMSCNGCRVLRKGCSESCILRPCLQWIDSPESQGHATAFVAKFFGRAGLMSFISAVPESQRPALFQSLLFEACGRTVNPVNGAVGLLWTGNWHVCQTAVDTILRGGTLRSMPELVGPSLASDEEASEATCSDVWNKKFQGVMNLNSNCRFSASRSKRKMSEEEVQETPPPTAADLDLCLTNYNSSWTGGKRAAEIRRRPGTPSMNSEESGTTTCFESGSGYHYVEGERKVLNLFV